MTIRRDEDGTVSIECRPSDSAEARCRDCQKRILWTVSPRGKNMPLDFGPVDDGDWCIVASSGPGKNPHAVRPRDAQPNAARYTCHHATCSERSRT